MCCNCSYTSLCDIRGTAYVRLCYGRMQDFPGEATLLFLSWMSCMREPSCDVWRNHALVIGNGGMLPIIFLDGAV